MSKYFFTQPGIDALLLIPGLFCLGLLTRGSDNRFGRLIDQLGTRQFLQVGISSEFRVNEKDVIRKHLGIDEDCKPYFAWNTIALSDPAKGNNYCSDCDKIRGHFFLEGIVGPGCMRTGVNKSKTEPTT